MNKLPAFSEKIQNGTSLTYEVLINGIIFHGAYNILLFSIPLSFV